MIKFSRNRLLSRRQALRIGVSSVTALAVLSWGNLQALSYLIYTFANKQKVKNNQLRTFKIVGQNSLKQRAKAKGLIYGGYPESDAHIFVKDLKLQSTFIRECSMMTVAYYWSSIRPSIETFNFTGTDYYVKFAMTNKLQMRGIPLVWHEVLPEWLPPVLNSENAKQILTKHLDTVVRRYAGKMHSWDVVNEAVHIRDNRADGLRKTPWLEFLGADYIDLAFRVVAKADPQAKLVYNEYGLESDTPDDAAKRKAVLNLLRRLKSKGTPIYALGLQSHLSGDFKNFNPRIFREFLKSVASLGLKIMITELDVADDQLPLNLDQRDRLVAGVYEDYLSTALAEKAVISVATWGLSDRDSWLKDHNPRADKAAVRTLPFDREMKPKLAWKAIARALDRAPKR
jgi:endo-1,4-beta-xylanase